MNIGDRIIVSTRRKISIRHPQPFWHGRIVGESRDKLAWVVKRDLHKATMAYHKSFCQPEPEDDEGRDWTTTEPLPTV
jgi:hypothetical protein